MKADEKVALYWSLHGGRPPIGSRRRKAPGEKSFILPATVQLYAARCTERRVLPLGHASVVAGMLLLKQIVQK